jgi:GR25 family glycosyltransferase involved in LPS biosynthesis
MIRRLKYNEIDFEKYAACLENSEQRKYSASKTFLDVTTNKQWDILVYNDYEAVMPVPFIFKKGVKVVHNPLICQQLGVFSVLDDQKTNERFLHFLQKNYLIRAYHFNETKGR